MRSFAKIPFSSVFLALWLVLTTVSAPAAEKRSFKEVVAELKDPTAITELFKIKEELSKEQSKQLKKVLKENDKNLKSLLADFEAVTNFHRGEIEDEAALNGVIQYLQLSMLQVRSLIAKKSEKDWQEADRIFKAWFQFAADFPYEEASLVGLRFTSVVRSFLLDEMEIIIQNNREEIAKKDVFRKTLLALRAPWPVDRVIMTEAKKMLRQTPMQVAEKLAKDIQKNPYQTTENSLKKIKGGGAEELAFLKEIWREKDIELMKTEMNRLGRMKLELASSIYEQKKQKKAANIDELIMAGFLDRAPLDYKTSKPMTLE